MNADRRLIQKLMETIHNRPERTISFREYMEICLYDPEFGYYMKEKDRIGRDGDFYTSASIGGVMGEVVARYIADTVKLWGVHKPCSLVEWGGGTGALALQILDELKRSFADVYESLAYISIEVSPAHRAVQADKLREHTNRIRWMTSEQWLQQGSWERVIVLSNELLDAFPVHLVQMRGGRPYEGRVGWDDAAGWFAVSFPEEAEPAVREYVEAWGAGLEEGQRLEVNLAAAGWLQTVGAAIQSGEVLTIDYGDRAEELYTPHRFQGTLMCYEKHRAQSDPFQHPGNQDITSHVNFSSLIRAGEAAGFETKAYTTQKQFLVDNGILQLLQDTLLSDPFSPAARRNRAIRQLLLSDQMSELFKVLIQKKGELR